MTSVARTSIGFVLAFVIGVGCHVAGIPLPAPPALVGAILVLAMTVGYLLVDHVVAEPAQARSRCGGPTGARREEQ